MPRTLHSLLVAAQEGEVETVAAILDSGEVGINAANESEITAVQVSPWASPWRCRWRPPTGRRRWWRCW